MASRLDAIRVAERPKMQGRAMLSGPSGSGKTWTSLSMATRLAVDDGRPGEILVIDTERESALTYADVFTFQHLPWRPPYDPDELADTLTKIGERYAVCTIDSFSHFWRGLGGTLDIADGKFGGWKTARPVQERITQAVLAMPCHVILCVRSKMSYLVQQQSNGKQEISKVGLEPIQDETLVYEMNVALDIDLEHRITVTKSRTPAVPVGRMYPAGMEAKAADDYAGWLAGGIPPASHEEVNELVDSFGQIVDAELRKQVKAEFVQTFGMPQAITAAQIGEAKAWLAARIDGNDEKPDPDPTPDAEPKPEATPDAEPAVKPPDGQETDPGPDSVDTDSKPSQDDPEANADDPSADPACMDGLTGESLVEAVVAHLHTKTNQTLAAELTSRGKKVHKSWVKDTLGRLLAVEMLGEKGITIKAGDVPWDGLPDEDIPFDQIDTTDRLPV